MLKSLCVPRNLLLGRRNTMVCKLNHLQKYLLHELIFATFNGSFYTRFFIRFPILYAIFTFLHCFFNVLKQIMQYIAINTNLNTQLSCDILNSFISSCNGLVIRIGRILLFVEELLIIFNFFVPLIINSSLRRNTTSIQITQLRFFTDMPVIQVDFVFIFICVYFITHVLDIN